MNRTEEIKQIFERLPWLNLSKFAEVIGMDRKNIAKYVSGKLEVSEKNYLKIMDGLAAIKKQLP